MLSLREKLYCESGLQIAENVDQAVDQAVDQVVDQAVDQAVDKAVDQAVDQACWPNRVDKFEKVWKQKIQFWIREETWSHRTLGFTVGNTTNLGED